MFAVLKKLLKTGDCLTAISDLQNSEEHVSFEAGNSFQLTVFRASVQSYNIIVLRDEDTPSA